MTARKPPLKQYRTKQGRVVLRCVVRDGDEVIEVIEQSMFSGEIKNALRRKHFAWRFESAMKESRKIEFFLRLAE